MTNKDAAMDYARRGWSIFPCRPKSKEPATPHGFKDATADEATIEAWWAENSEYNIGFVPASAGVIVVDLDIRPVKGDKPAKDGPEALKRFSSDAGIKWPWPKTLCAKTGSGGHHLFYRLPNGTEVPSRTDALGPDYLGVDVKSSGGYVLLPPSVHPNGTQYMWQGDPNAPIAELPEELLAAIMAQPSVPQALPSADSPTGRVLSRLADVRQTSTGWKVRCPAHEDEHQSLSVSVGDGDSVLLKCFAGCEYEKIMRAIGLEQKDGFPKPVIARTNKSLKLVRASGIAIEPLKWFMRDRIPSGTLTLFEGDGGIGKTTAALWIVAQATTGAPLPDGSQRGPMTAVVLAEEDSKSHLCAKLKMYGANLDRVRFVVFDDVSSVFRIPNDLDRLRQLIESEAPDTGILYIDALFNHCGTRPDKKQLDAKDTQDARAMCAPLATLSEELGIVTIVTRHWTKGTRSAADRGRGSGEFRNVARSTIVFAKHPRYQDRFVAAVDKRNLGRPTPALVYQIESVPVMGADGKPLIDDDGQTYEVGCPKWLGTEEITADSLAMATPTTDADRDASQEARDIILLALLDGAKSALELNKTAKEAGIADTTFNRERSKLRKDALINRGHGRGNFSDPWVWELTEKGRFESERLAAPRSNPSSPRWSSRWSTLPSPGDDHLGQLDGHLEATQAAPGRFCLATARPTLGVGTEATIGRGRPLRVRLRELKPDLTLPIAARLSPARRIGVKNVRVQRASRSSVPSVTGRQGGLTTSVDDPRKGNAVVYGPQGDPGSPIVAPEPSQTPKRPTARTRAARSRVRCGDPGPNAVDGDSSGGVGRQGAGRATGAPTRCRLG